MIKKIIFSFIVTLFIFSCGEKSEEKKEISENDKEEDLPDSLEKKINSDSALLNTHAFNLTVFRNIEQIPFCIALPLNKYTLDEKQSDETAKFIFTKNDKPENYIEVRGMFRLDESVSLKEYFENSTSEEETEAIGKIINQKFINEKGNCFVVRGYWSNFPEQEFVEIVFLRKEDVVTFYWSYDM